MWSGIEREEEAEEEEEEEVEFRFLCFELEGNDEEEEDCETPKCMPSIFARSSLKPTHSITTAVKL